MEIVDWNLVIPRFIYCGHAVTPWFKKDTTVGHQYVSNFMFLDKIHHMPLACIDPVLQIIRKAFVKGNLVSVDNACLVLAHMAQHSKIKARRKLFNNLPDLLLTDVHLFHFVARYHKLRGENAGFPSGARRMLVMWYKKHTALQLAEMIGKHKGFRGYTHNDLIRTVHMSLNDDEDKLMVIQGSCTRATKILTQVDSKENANKTYGPGFQRFIDICRLKVCKPDKNYAQIIETHNFKVDHVPSTLMHCQRLWHLMLPTLTYKQLLFYLPHFDKLKMLFKGHEFVEKYITALARVEALKDARMHPIDIFFAKKLYRHKRLPYKQEKMEKLTDEQKKKKLEDIVAKNMPLPALLNVLDASLEVALTNLKSCGLQLYITVDLRENALKRRIYGYQMISVLEATILLTSCLYFPNKKFSVLKSYSSTPNVLEPLEMGDGFATSLVAASKMLKSKTLPVLSNPITDAIKRGLKKINVFITISTHFVPEKDAYNNLLTAINKYRNKNKSHARYIFIMLCNPKKAQNFNGLNKPPVLIITGLTPETPKIINAFLDKDFA